MNQNKQPKVSVVIIFLNGEKFIIESIESVMSQTFADWELLLVDDGSADRSTIIAKEYAHQYPNKIYYLEHPNHQNLGMSASRNFGSQKAIGKYLISMDCDDVLLPHKLERQVSILEANPEVAMVYPSTLIWYSWTGKKEDFALDHMNKLGVISEKIYRSPTLMTVYLSGKGNFPTNCGLMVRKSILEQIEGWENEFKYFYELQVFVSKIILNYPVYVDGILEDKYRQHPDMSNRSVIDMEANNAHLIYLDWLSKYIEQNGLNDPLLDSALKKAFFGRYAKTIVRKILPHFMIYFLKSLRKYTWSKIRLLKYLLLSYS